MKYFKLINPKIKANLDLIVDRIIDKIIQLERGGPNGSNSNSQHNNLDSQEISSQ